MNNCPVSVFGFPDHEEKQWPQRVGDCCPWRDLLARLALAWFCKLRFGSVPPPWELYLNRANDMAYIAQLLPLWEAERSHVTGPWFKTWPLSLMSFPAGHMHGPNSLLKELDVSCIISLEGSWKLAPGLLCISLHELSVFEILLCVLLL